MAIPQVTITIQDGALGITPLAPAKTQVKIGVSSGGTPNVILGFTDNTTMQQTLGQGKLVEAMAGLLTTAGGIQYAMPASPDAAGAVAASTTHTGTGLGTVTPQAAGGPVSALSVKCTTSGALGTAQFTFQIGTGAISAPVLSAASWNNALWAGGYLVAGTLTKLQFSAANFTANDVWTIDTLGVITAGGGNAGPGTISAQLTAPSDDYQVTITIDGAGGIGVGTFHYTVDGGNTQSATIQIPGGAGKYAIPNTGLVVTFANGGGAFVVGDTYAYYAATAGYTTTSLNTAGAALLADLQHEWFMAHAVGTPASAAAAATLAAAADTLATTAASQFRYVFFVTECPTLGTDVISGGVPISDSADTDSVVAAAFANFASVRTMVCAGDADISSALTGRIQRRNAAWAVTARLSQVNPGVAASRVKDGPLSLVRKLWRDEQATPALDAARFCTLRTVLGKQGFFVTNPLIMATAGSDYGMAHARRVMDVACRTTRLAEIEFLNDDVRVDRTTGFIDERDAQHFEADVNQKLNDAVVSTGDATASSVSMSRNANILSTGTEPVTVRVTPKAYLYQIQTNIGFFNPATAA